MGTDQLKELKRLQKENERLRNWPVGRLGFGRYAVALSRRDGGATGSDVSLRPTPRTEPWRRSSNYVRERGPRPAILLEHGSRLQRVLETANPALRHTVKNLYGKAGGDLAGDLERLAKTRRIAAPPMRLTSGRPQGATQSAARKSR